MCRHEIVETLYMIGSTAIGALLGAALLICLTN